MKKLWERMGRNTSLKLIALFFALVTWSYVMMLEDPQRPRRLSNIPITVTGLEKLAEKGLTVRGSIDKIFAAADVTVELRISETGYLNSENVHITADLSRIQRKGIYEVVLTASSSVGTVTDIRPSKLKIEIDGAMTRTVPVTYQFTGKLEDDLYAYTPELSLKKVQITGAKTDVEQVASAVCRIDLSKVKDSVNAAYTLVMVDSAGNELSADLFKLEEAAVTVNMEVVGRKEVPIENNAALCIANYGKLMERFEIVSFKIAPKTAVLIGDAQVLKDIRQATIVPVEVKGREGEQVIAVTLDLPKNVAVPDGAEYMLTVELDVKNR